jgi:L-fucose mutarotase
MLKGIPSILTPELLKIMMEMGHSDELILADGNYPRLGHPERVVRCDGHGIPELLDAIMRFFPLDTYVEHPVILMNVPPGVPEPPIWEEYRKIIARYEPKAREEPIERFAFYKRAAAGYAVVTSGETAAYGNIILKKGVIRP